MRAWIDLFEKSGLVTLYRGDNNFIHRFEMSKTDSDALFGIGVYLTDDPRVAGDYTIKGTDKDSIVYRHNHRDGDDPPTSEKELVTDYLRHLIKEAGGFDQLQALHDEWSTKARNAAWAMDYTTHEDMIVKRREVTERFTAEYKAVRSKLIQKLTKDAKAQYVKERPNLRVVRMTTGEYIFTRMNRPASVSRFEIPASYLDRCLHAERPLSDETLAVIKKAYMRAFKEDKPLDLRVYDPATGGEKLGHKFDDFIAGYKKHGARYAWTDTINGGKGQNPTLDVLWAGTHSGYHVFRDRENQQALIADLEAIGYVGLAYDGGKRVTGTGTRGGGAEGMHHNVYILWNEEDVNNFRAGNETPVDAEVGSGLEKGIRAKALT